MEDKLKFDEDLLEDKNNSKNQNLRSKLSNRKYLFDENLKDFLINLNKENCNNCFHEFDLFKKCEMKIKNKLLINSNNYLYKDLEKECSNQIIYLYNCLKRYGRLI